MRVLIISADQFEDTELLVPLYRIQEAGGEVSVASAGSKRITGKKGYEVSVDLDITEVEVSEFDALVLPGGKAPAALREDEAVLSRARAFMEAGKPVAAICHGPQILISAGVMQGRTATAYPEVGDELRQAGAEYQDRSVVVDGQLITSRVPSDLPDFNRELLKQLS